MIRVAPSDWGKALILFVQRKCKVHFNRVQKDFNTL